MKKILINFYLSYLRFFAKLQLKKVNPRIIGVGGSSGKSSATFLIAEILSQKYKVKQGKGKNSETGIPLNILDIEIDDYSLISWIKILLLAPLRIITNFKKYDYYVAEMGIDSPIPPKNMEYLLKTLTLDIGVLTNITLEHSQNFDILVNEESDKRQDKILGLTIKEEALLLKSVSANGTSIINWDDINIENIQGLKSSKLSVSGKNKNADFYINEINSSLINFETTFIYKENEYAVKINQPLPEYFALTFVLVIAVVSVCKIEISEAVNILENNFNLPPGRFSVFKGIKNATIFDSSYNSSFESASGAIRFLSKFEKKRKVAVLGDMRELGSMSGIMHNKLAHEILKNLDFVILIGPQMKEFVAPIMEEKKFKFESFLTFSDAKDKFVHLIKDDDLVLVKGSQNTLFLERVVEMLLEDKADVKLLCRRGEYWNKKRKESS